MTTGTGLDAQVGYKLETTPGTPVTVDEFVEFTSEGIARSDTWVEPDSLRAGTTFKRATQLLRASRTVSGDLGLNFMNRGMGGLMKLAFGSGLTAPTLISGTAYKQVHTPSQIWGLAATIQIGRPEPGSGTVQPHTYTGCKVASWQLSCDSGGKLTLSLTVDGMDESTSTALAAASYPSGIREFSFAQVTTFEIGGTVSTSGGVASVTGASDVTSIVNSISVSGDTPMATERYGLGNQGVKAEQLQNDFSSVTGEFGAEYNKSQWYDLFTGDQYKPLHVVFEGEQIGTSGSKDTLDILIPAMRVKSAPPQVGGPDVVSQSVQWEAYDDTSNAPIQLTIISADDTL